MKPATIEATYLIETPLEPAAVAAIMAGEQSSGTFVRVAGETDELRRRAAAEVLAVEELESAAAPSLSSAWLERQRATGPWRRARVRIAFPIANVGANLPTLAATVAGNLYDLGEITGLKLLDVDIPQDYRIRFELPVLGVAGTRERLNVHGRPFFGTIIKPNVGMSADEIADLVALLCEAGVDFIKDDEICANPDHAPLDLRVPAVMAKIRAYRDRTGRDVMVAFNITDEVDSMRRHTDLVEREGGSCVMASLNWCGLSCVQTLRRATRSRFMAIATATAPLADIRRSASASTPIRRSTGWPASTTCMCTASAENSPMRPKMWRRRPGAASSRSRRMRATLRMRCCRSFPPASGPAHCRAHARRPARPISCSSQAAASWPTRTGRQPALGA